MNVGGIVPLLFIGLMGGKVAFAYIPLEKKLYLQVDIAESVSLGLSTSEGRNSSENSSF